MPLTAEEAKVGTTAYYPDDGIMVTIVDASESGQVVVRPVDPELAAKNPDFTVDPEELDAVRVEPIPTPQALVDRIRTPATGVVYYEGVELAGGMIHLLGARLHEGVDSRQIAHPTVTIKPDWITGIPVIVVSVTTQLDGEAAVTRRYLISDTGELEL